MAGPASMALGGYAFEAHGFSFTERGHEINTEWAEIAVAGDMNPLQWTGGKGESLTIRGVLFPREFGGEAALTGLKGAAGQGQILPLVTLAPTDDNILGLWTIQTIGDDASHFLATGPLRKAYRIALKKYVAGASSGFSPASVLTLF